MTTTPTSELTALAETVEAEFMHAYESGAPAAVSAALGIATARIGGGVVLAMREDPVGYWNKALGFGIAESVTADLVQEIIDFYLAHGVPAAALQIAPALLPPDWAEIRAVHGITAGSAWVKLGAAVNEVDTVDTVDTAVSTRLRVGPVGQGDAEQWASTVLHGFGMWDERLAGMLTAGAADRDCRPYAVWDGEDLVAGGNLFVHGPAGSINSAATLPDHRGKGAQSALIGARIEAARRSGCRWVTAEAGLPADGAANPSLTNLERAGLRRLYVRQNWLWRAEDDAAGRR